jgi:hypothetical protein
MMERSFAVTLASALIPGGKLANGVEAPCAGRLLDEAVLSQWLAQKGSEAAVAAILREIGGADAFIEASPERRVAALQVAEADQRSSFDKLAAALLTLYYEHPAVLEAFGWRSAPPQPGGHDLEGLDDSRFERVVARGPIWRKID